MGFWDKFKFGRGQEDISDSKNICTPLEGMVIPLNEIPDPVFSEGVLGFGCGIEPTSEIVVAPFDGEIIQVSETKHAIGLRNADGIEVLIHVGMDTVNMNGKGFDVFVKVGQNVRKGEKLMTFSAEEIKAAGHPTITAFVVCDGAGSGEIQVLKAGTVLAGEELFKVK